MATAEELLNSEEIAARTFSINSDLRTVTPPANFKVFGVESDDDVARIYFKGPRFYKGVDLSTFRVRVNILNANADPDGYSVDDLQVDNSTDTIVFSWLIGRNTAQYDGEIKFSLCFRELDENAYVIREFNTTIARGQILEGLETTTLILQKYPDLIDNIILRLESLEENGLPAVILDKTLSVENMAADAKAVGDKIAEMSSIERLVITADLSTTPGTSRYSSDHIIKHVNAGGDVVLSLANGVYAELYSITGTAVWFRRFDVTEVRAVQYSYVIWEDSTISVEETMMSAGTGLTDEQAEQLQANTDAIADLNNPVKSIALDVGSHKYTMILTMEDDTEETHILETDENDYPTKLTVNGHSIDCIVTGV